MKIYLLLIFLAISIFSYAQQKTAVDFPKKIFTLTRFMEKNHYQPIKWNDTTAAILYDKWIEDIDDEKLFFTKNDITILNKFRTTIDNEILTNKTDFFTTSTNIYRRQLQKIDSFINIILAKPLDFKKPENLIWPAASYANNDAELLIRWQQYLKWKILSKIAEQKTEDKKLLKTELPEDFASLEIKIRTQLKKQEQSYIKNLLMTPASFIAEKQDEYLDAIAWCYDPHSNYMNMGKKQEFEAAVSASEYSVGFDLEENEKGDIVIDFLQPGGSAWRSGKLHKGDVLLKIKTDNVEKDVADIPAEKLSEIISGNSLADVEITIKTAAGEQKKVKLLKEKVSDEESIVKSYVLSNSKKVGYINLPGFYSRENENIKTEADLTFDGCANDVSKEIIKLKKDNIDGLILDLRFNGGGSMWEAMQLAGIFIDIGPVASTKERDGKVHFMKDPNRGTIYDGPLMVLINGASASASEFTSAVLQDYNRALIVGGTTYGKGTAQILMPLDTLKADPNKKYEDFVKVTMEKFYRVDGTTVQWKGVVPDIALPDIYGMDDYKEKANKSALLPDVSKKGTYQLLPALPVAKLKSKSEQRVSAETYFKSMNSLIGWAQTVSNGLTIPLQWPSFAAYKNKNKDILSALGDDENDTKIKTSISANNNAFDKQQINQATTKTKEINDVYLKQLESDKTLEEAYKIMIDWLVN